MLSVHNILTLAVGKTKSDPNVKLILLTTGLFKSLIKYVSCLIVLFPKVVL